MKNRTSLLSAIGISLVAAAFFLNANYILGTWRCGPRMGTVLVLLFCTMAAVLACLPRLLRLRNPAANGPIPWEYLAFTLCLGVLCLTTYTYHKGFHFIYWPVVELTPQSLLRSRAALFLLLTPLASLLFLLKSRRWLDFLLPALLVLAEILCARAILDLTGGAALYNDDHPSFLFRIAEFWGSLPWRENYVPQWNAGVVNSVLSSSGTAGYALLTSPLRLFFHDPHEYHTYGILLVQAFIIPWTTVWAMRTAGIGWRGACAGGLLSLFANRVFFMWTFHFGTVGAGISQAMLPAAFLFLYAVADRHVHTPAALVGLVFSMLFLCQWPQMWMAAAVLALAALTSWRKIFLHRRTLLLLIACAACTALLLLPSLVSVAGGKDLIQYTTKQPTAARSLGRILHTAWTVFLRYTADVSYKVHPLTLLFGFCGLWFCRQRSLRRWLVIVSIGLILLYSYVHVRSPNMQLMRMSVAFGIFAVVPAAEWIGRIWRERHPCVLALQGAALVLLALGVCNISLLYNGKGFAPFRPVPGFVTDLTDWIRANVPEDHRFLFVGRTQHAYGRGHTAYLPILAGREMVSCDYYEFPAGLFEPYCPPQRFQKDYHGYMTTYGVSHAIAFRDNYVAELRAHPDQFEEVPEFRDDPKWGYFRVFRIIDSPGVLRGASGRVTADFNRIVVDFDGPVPESAVIAYNWNERLRVEAPAAIQPVDAGFDATFIEIHPNGQQHVEIRYKNRF